MAASNGVVAIAVAVATPVAETISGVGDESDVDQTTECLDCSCSTAHEQFETIKAETVETKKTQNRPTLAEISDAFDLFLSTIPISSFCLSPRELDHIRHKCISLTHQRAVELDELNNIANEQNDTESALQEQLKDALREKATKLSTMQKMISDVNESRQEMEDLLEYKISCAIRAKSLGKEKGKTETTEEVKEEKSEN